MFLNIHHKNISVLIVGCGRFGAYLASSLSVEGYDVIIIDKNEKSFHRLKDGFGGFQISGDASDLDVLKNCGIEKCFLVMVATENDNMNCMIAQMANRIFHIDQVFIRLNDPHKEELLKGTGIRAIYPARLCLKEFETISNIHFMKETIV